MIEGVGTLIQSNNSTLLFVQDLTTNHLLTSYGMEKIQSPAIKRVSVQETCEAKIKHIVENHLPSNKNRGSKMAAVLLPLAMLSLIGVSKQEQLQTAVANLNLFANTNTEIVVEIIESHTFDYGTYTLPFIKLKEVFSNLLKQKCLQKK